ncbi:MSLN protein, partial [Notiomystis cincta]|nr:MSLN protein [Notiomystis cincta]
RDAPAHARQCLCLAALQKVPGTEIPEEESGLLGRLLCELGGEYIRSSAGSLLRRLGQCGSLLPGQEEAVRDVLSSGNTTFGPPAQWSAFTLSELGRLISVLDHSILQQIPK